MATATSPFDILPPNLFNVFSTQGHGNLQRHYMAILLRIYELAEFNRFGLTRDVVVAEIVDYLKTVDEEALSQLDAEAEADDGERDYAGYLLRRLDEAGYLALVTCMTTLNSCGARLHEFGAMPLREGDRVRIEAQLARPSYIYLLWIDSEGNVQPVYPWKLGQWEQRPATEVSVSRVELPERVDQGSPVLPGRPGMESVILLARDTPLPPDVDLAELLTDLPTVPIPQEQSHRVTHFLSGKAVTREQDRERGIGFAPEDLADPVRTLHQQIIERLKEHFTLVRGVSFANLGSSMDQP